MKSDIDKLDIYKLENEPTNLSNLKSKVDKLDVDKLVPVIDTSLLILLPLIVLLTLLFANFIKTTHFHDKLKNLNKNVTSNKTKDILVENELN